MGSHALLPGSGICLPALACILLDEISLSGANKRSCCLTVTWSPGRLICKRRRSNFWTSSPNGRLTYHKVIHLHFLVNLIPAGAEIKRWKKRYGWRECTAAKQTTEQIPQINNSSTCKHVQYCKGLSLRYLLVAHGDWVAMWFPNLEMLCHMFILRMQRKLNSHVLICEKLRKKETCSSH